jgi:hypothetical protein
MKVLVLLVLLAFVIAIVQSVPPANRVAVMGGSAAVLTAIATVLAAIAQ